jgi:uncharacterized membrane protein
MFTHRVADVVQVIEAVGVAILVVGGLIVLVRSTILYVTPDGRTGAYQFCRRHLGRVILLGLEVLIVADIIRTVIVDQTPASVAVLATIVVIRIVLSWSLAVEIDGMWPWNKARLSPTDTESGPEGGV